MTTPVVVGNKILEYPTNETRPAKPSLTREAANVDLTLANVENIKAQAQLHIAQAESARANGQSEVANAPLVRELLRIVREKEKEDEDQLEDIDETQYLHILRQDRNTKKIGDLISFVASFASEEPHDLISQSAKGEVRLDPTMKRIKSRKLDWSFFVSDRLEAHVIEVASMIRTTFNTHLSQTQPSDFIVCDDDSVRIRFHRAVAAMYRGSSVFSVRRYSTSKAIDTLQSNIASHLRFFSCVRYANGKLIALSPTLAPLPRHLYGI